MEMRGEYIRVPDGQQWKRRRARIKWADPRTFDEMQNERHAYEKCQYEEFKKRVSRMEELRAAKASESAAAA